MNLLPLGPKPSGPCHVPTFLAVELASGDAGLPMAFTSKAMRWGKDSWLLDLGVCRRYWRAQAAWRRSTPEALLLGILKRHAQDQEFRAVLADDPWKAVLLLAYMEERSLSGLISHGEHFGRGLYQQVSWSAWISAALQYGGHARAKAVPRFNEPIFRRQLKHLGQAMQRLAQPRPASMAAATPASMKRRFGQHVSILWDWTFAAGPSPEPVPAMLFPTEDQPFDAGFPWTSWTPALKPTVARHLDYAVWQFDHIEPLLAGDFDRLCRADGWLGGESVVHVAWNLTLDDSTTCQIDVRFRHPHRLHEEMGTHKTAVLQACYAFTAKFRPVHDADGLDPPKPIVAWSLTVEARMAAATALSDLFGNVESLDARAARSLAIENQLPVPVDRYCLAGDWLPEGSFACGDAAADDEPVGPWLSVARRRPLYIYREPLVLSVTERHRRTTFLERTTAKWWPGLGSTLQDRDYYALEDFKGKFRWGYRDATGKWCVHGIFG